MNTIRDQIKNLDFLDSCIRERFASHCRRIEKFETNSIVADRIQAVKVDMAKNLLYLNLTRYSAGHEIDSWKESMIEVVELFYQYWSGYWTLKSSNGIALNQYSISSYDEMLWMLSLGLLLDIPENHFLKLVDVIDRDGVKDNLFEYIIRAKIKERKPIFEESYKDFFGVPKCFEKLRMAIVETDKTKSESLIQEFIRKDWYKNHKDAGWYDSHKSKHNTYFGYWSFETAAVVVIMGLDDSSFRDCQYYPKDLVDYARARSIKEN